MENLNPLTPAQIEHEKALQLAKREVTPLYEGMEASNPNRRPNKLRDAIDEHVARAQGRAALGEIVSSKSEK